MNIESRAYNLLYHGNMEKSYDFIAQELSKLEKTPFHEVIHYDFTNDVSLISKKLDEYINGKSILGALYLEMNGFDINTNLWYFSIFGYDRDGGSSNWEWLSDWQNESERDFRLLGMEKIQKIYKENELGSDQSVAASLLIVSKFQILMRLARCHMVNQIVPIYCTAHDYDFIAKI